MFKTFTIVAATAFAVAVLPSISYAQMEQGNMSGGSMPEGSMGGMKNKSMMMKKHKKMHHSMHHTMMKKPMSSNGSM